MEPGFSVEVLVANTDLFVGDGISGDFVEQDGHQGGVHTAVVELGYLGLDSDSELSCASYQSCWMLQATWN